MNRRIITETQREGIRPGLFKSEYTRVHTLTLVLPDKAKPVMRKI